jgi:hypothetical protein
MSNTNGENKCMLCFTPHLRTLEDMEFYCLVLQLTPTQLIRFREVFASTLVAGMASMGNKKHINLVELGIHALHAD